MHTMRRGTWLRAQCDPLKRWLWCNNYDHSLADTESLIRHQLQLLSQRWQNSPAAVGLAYKNYPPYPGGKLESAPETLWADEMLCRLGRTTSISKLSWPFHRFTSSVASCSFHFWTSSPKYPLKAFWPQGQLIGFAIGAKAETDLYLPGFFMNCVTNHIGII